MSASVIIRPAAQAELADAAAWYERQRAGLGDSFTEAVQEVIDEIAANPLRYADVFNDVREAQISAFPSYCVYYQSRGNRVVVISVFHTSRDPSVWQSRA